MRYITAGESHGPQLTTIIEGIPAGMPLTTEDINHELARRQKVTDVEEGCKLKLIWSISLVVFAMDSH